jgi:hypothetical protein
MADFFIHGFETTFLDPEALAEKQASCIGQVILLLSAT